MESSLNRQRRKYFIKLPMAFTVPMILSTWLFRQYDYGLEELVVAVAAAVIYPVLFSMALVGNKILFRQQKSNDPMVLFVIGMIIPTIVFLIGVFAMKNAYSLYGIVF